MDRKNHLMYRRHSTLGPRQDNEPPIISYVFVSVSADESSVDGREFGRGCSCYCVMNKSGASFNYKHKTHCNGSTKTTSPEAEFLDVIGTTVLIVFLLLFTSPNRF